LIWNLLRSSSRITLISSLTTIGITMVMRCSTNNWWLEILIPNKPTMVTSGLLEKIMMAIKSEKLLVKPQVNSLPNQRQTTPQSSGLPTIMQSKWMFTGSKTKTKKFFTKLSILASHMSNKLLLITNGASMIMTMVNLLRIMLVNHYHVNVKLDMLIKVSWCLSEMTVMKILKCVILLMAVMFIAHHGKIPNSVKWLLVSFAMVLEIIHKIKNLTH